GSERHGIDLAASALDLSHHRLVPRQRRDGTVTRRGQRRSCIGVRGRGEYVVAGETTRNESTVETIARPGCIHRIDAVARQGFAAGAGGTGSSPPSRI